MSIARLALLFLSQWIRIVWLGNLSDKWLLQARIVARAICRYKMWDIPALIQSVVELLKEKVKQDDPDKQTIALKNKIAKNRYEVKKFRKEFSARMRRFLARLKLLAFLCLLGCASVQPNLTPTEREQYIQALEENIALKNSILECLDHLDKCE